MLPLGQGGVLKKSDIGQPRDFRHVGGYSLAERIQQFNRLSAPHTPIQAATDVDESVYDDVYATPATPRTPPQPIVRRLAPPPPPTAKPRTLPPHVAVTPSLAVGDDQSDDDDSTSVLQLALASICLQNAEDVMCPDSTHDYANVDISTGDLDDAHVYSNVSEDSAADDDRHLYSNVLVTNGHSDVTEVPIRHPVGRSPSTVAALSVLDSVIMSYSYIEEEDEEDVSCDHATLSDETLTVVPNPAESTPAVLPSPVESTPAMVPTPKPTPRRLLSTDNMKVGEPPPPSPDDVACSRDQDVCLSLDDVNDPALRLLLRKAGVSSKDLQDQQTRDFIFQFILDHGGQDAVQREVLLLDKFKTVAVRKKKRRHVITVHADDDDDDDDSLGTDL